MHLMPVAAMLGCYAAYAACRVMYLVYEAMFAKPPKTPPRSTTQVAVQPKDVLQSQYFFVLVVSMIVALIGYAYVVAMIEGAADAAEYARFDPFQILQIDPDTTNTTLIKQAYRKLSLKHHPDKLAATATTAEKDAATKLFYSLQAAYQALTDEVAKKNYEVHGHPEGAFQRPAFKLALPNWLLFPTGKVAAAMLLMYLGMLAFLIYWVVTSMQAAARRAAEEKAAVPASMLDKTNSVTVEDLRYLASKLEPESTHLEVLMAVLSTPENILWCTEQARRVEEQRNERRESKEKEKPAKNDTMDIDEIVNEGGWEDDDEDDDDDNKDGEDNDAEDAEEKAALAKAKQAEKEKLADLERLKQATGKAGHAHGRH